MAERVGTRAIAVVSVVIVLSANLGASKASAAPPNDNFADAPSIGIQGSFAGNTSGATIEPGEPTPCGFIGATVWYKFTAPATARLNITTLTTDPDPVASGDFDTVLALYGVNPGAPGTSFTDLYNVACNDDRPGGRSVRSAINWEQGMTAGQLYFVQVGGYQARTGNYQIHFAYQKFSDARPCNGGFMNWASLICRKFQGFDSKQDGFQATWASSTLNISNDAAQSGNFIAQPLWFMDLCTALNSCDHWLEIGDTAGSGSIDGHQDYWERWWYWVDGTNFPTTYTEHGIALSPNDGASRTYIVQWEAAEALWAVYICAGSCTREGSVPWIAPTAMGDQFEEVGLEVSIDANNLNSNSVVFQDSLIQSRTGGATWASLSSANAEITAGCGFGYPANYCLNGIWNAGPPPYDNWRNNKP